MRSHVTDKLLTQLIDLQKQANDQREELIKRIGEIEMGLFAFMMDLPGKYVQKHIDEIIAQTGHPEAFK
jgi:hypothetical protein